MNIEQAKAVEDGVVRFVNDLELLWAGGTGFREANERLIIFLENTENSFGKSSLPLNANCVMDILANSGNHKPEVVQYCLSLFRKMTKTFASSENLSTETFNEISYFLLTHWESNRHDTSEIIATVSRRKATRRRITV